MHPVAPPLDRAMQLQLLTDTITFHLDHGIDPRGGYFQLMAPDGAVTF